MAEIISSKISKPQSLRVLAVDDSEGDVLLIIRELKKGGYEPEYERVETATAMKQALKEKQWDIILCDYQLPRFNAPSAIALLKETNIDIPLIIVSGAIGEEMAVECMRSGANDYVMKGNISRLVPAIERELREAESRRQHRRTEEALLLSEENFRRSFDESPLGVRIVCPKGETTYANRAILDIYGYNSIDELKAIPTQKRYTPESFVQFQIRREKRKRGDSLPSEYEISIIGKDAEVRHLQVIRKEILWNSEKQFQVIYRDITERKLAVEALRESEEKYRFLTENTKDVIWIFDAETLCYLYVSPSAMTTRGYKPEDRIGVPITHNYPPEVAEYMTNITRNRVKDFLSGKEPPDKFYINEAEQPCKDGSTVWTEVVTSYYVNPKSGRVEAHGITRDITDRKRAEEEKKLLEERLNRAEKMESLGTLAGGVAHDLNNVLGIVVGYAEMALDGVDKSSPLKHHLENVMGGGLKAAAIVDDLLTLARRGVTGSEVLNLNKIIADFQKSPELEKLYTYHPSVKIKTDMDNDLLNISGSSVHLNKSLYNLISNASEAMSKGGTLTIKTTNQSLDKSIQGYENIREGDYVVLSVSDTGEGISETNLKHIFEPFYTKKKMGRSGTGLGLAVVWGTVKDHHGYINVKSEIGKGTTFTLYFPVTREDIAAKVETVPISAYMGKGESILIVDDVKEQRDLAKGMLASLNYTVTTAESGEEAVAYLKEHQVDLIVLDMIMDPGMDGLDTYKSIIKIRPNQKAIIVSGYSESERVKTAEGLGVGAYIRKPYIKEKLGMAMRKELDKTI